MLYDQRHYSICSVLDWRQVACILPGAILVWDFVTLAASCYNNHMNLYNCYMLNCDRTVFCRCLDQCYELIKLTVICKELALWAYKQTVWPCIHMHQLGMQVSENKHLALDIYLFFIMINEPWSYCEICPASQICDLCCWQPDVSIGWSGIRFRYTVRPGLSFHHKMSLLFSPYIILSLCNVTSETWRDIILSSSVTTFNHILAFGVELIHSVPFLGSVISVPLSLLKRCVCVPNFYVNAMLSYTLWNLQSFVWVKPFKVWLPRKI